MNKYTSKNLILLKGLEAVKKRPGMYIGSTDQKGLHHLVWELLDNAIDEALSGFAKNIILKIRKDNSFTIFDDGRGIPIDLHQETQKSGVELIFTELHAGGKFGQNNSAYQIAGGLNGVGASIVNALSSKLIATIYKNEAIYETIFEHGEIIQRTKLIGPTKKKGTKIQFWPNSKIFQNITFSTAIIKERIRETIFLNPSLKITFIDQRVGFNEVFESKEGIKEYVSLISFAKKTLMKPYSFKQKFEGIDVEIAFQYTHSYSETIISFVNNIKTKHGGTHETALKNSFVKILNEYGRKNKIIKENDKNLEGSDLREGLIAIIHVKIPEQILAFVGQTKDSLRTLEAKIAVEHVMKNELTFWLQKNKKQSFNIIDKSIKAQKARLAARKAREQTRNVNKKLKTKVVLSGKLTKAHSKNRLERELFLVEGDSAGGSAKLGRDKKTQAILPLRGKIINVEKNHFYDIFKNEEIMTIINTIGAGIDKDFKIEKIEYGKIIIMTDADTDGAHIQLLLLTFLFRYMKPLIENDCIYIAKPPLYRYYKESKRNSFEYYAWNEKELMKLQTEKPGGVIQRYKGLGEMNAGQLWETTMNPKTRNLIKVNIEDVFEIDKHVNVLMGENVEPRRQWIDKNIQFTLLETLNKN